MDKEDALSIADNFTDIGVEVSEIIIDSLLADGILKDIPLIGSIMGVFKAGKQLKDILYLNKLQAFVCGYKQLPERTAAKIMSDLENEETRKELGLNLLFNN